jgi:ubiquitin carboxyl-terminal hydrolase 9/24
LKASYTIATENNKNNKGIEFDNEVGIRASTGYVGLKNFGATCYMNALIQQLFMISDLRKGILSSEEPDDDLDNNVLHHFKQIFANL